MSYPDSRFPTTPDFPAVSIQAKFDVDWYTVTTEYITDIVAALAIIPGATDDIKLSASGAIQWGDSSKITWSGSAVEIADLEINEVTWDFGTLVVGDDMFLSGTLTTDVGVTLNISSHLAISGAINVDTVTDSVIELAQVAEPDDPTTTRAVLWLSNGMGSGDAGDIMVKLRYSGVTKTTTVVNFA